MHRVDVSSFLCPTVPPYHQLPQEQPEDYNYMVNPTFTSSNQWMVVIGRRGVRLGLIVTQPNTPSTIRG